MPIENFIIALDQWAKRGRRSVDISISTQTLAKPELDIWCYDFDIEAGSHAKSISEIPSREALIESRKQSLEQQLNQLNQERQSTE